MRSDMDRTAAMTVVYVYVYLTRFSYLLVCRLLNSIF